MSSRTAAKRVVAIGGEGIGIEVVDATCEILTGGGVPVEILTPAYGEAAIKSHGSPLPDETKRLCESVDGILFGAAGGPATSAVVTWLRWEKGVTASVRPVKHYPGAYSPLARPDGIDYVIIRECMEGLYPGREGDLADLARSRRHCGRGNRSGNGQAGRRVVLYTAPGVVQGRHRADRGVRRPRSSGLPRRDHGALGRA